MGAPATYSTVGKNAFTRTWWLLMIALPPLVWWMWVCASEYGGALAIPRDAEGLRILLSYVPMPTWPAVAFLFGWYGLQIALQIGAPGKWVEGTPLADGTRLPYKMNGWFSWWFTIGLFVALAWLGWVPATFLADQFGPLFMVFNAATFLFAIWLYFHGKQQQDMSTGRPLYDYFMGTTLNPRVGTFDVKLFCEARPGLILWVLINLSLAAKQVEVQGTLTAAMVLVCVFHFFYIADYFYNEPAILTTMDIKHEKFGWMLCWGDLVWVPFSYTLQAWYLVYHPHVLPFWAIAAIVALNAAGYAIFRAVNLQKHLFRDNPEEPIWGKKPTYIETQRGTLLLTSGWWGMSRHMNYTGDLMMAWAWCLPCGFKHVLPYFYVIYFTILLVHRERRDNDMCRAKYGDDWDRYCKQVPWRIVPYVY